VSIPSAQIFISKENSTIKEIRFPNKVLDSGARAGKTLSLEHLVMSESYEAVKLVWILVKRKQMLI
jgi:hypothetical protein